MEPLHQVLGLPIQQASLMPLQQAHRFTQKMRHTLQMAVFRCPLGILYQITSRLLIGIPATHSVHWRIQHLAHASHFTIRLHLPITICRLGLTAVES